MTKLITISLPFYPAGMFVFLTYLFTPVLKTFPSFRRLHKAMTEV